MFGANRVMKQDVRDDGKLWVQEIFASVQGEGAHAGVPSIFIRLAGCNLRCSFCDTEFESAFEHADNLMEVTTVTDRVLELTVRYPGCNNVVITGGEPFRQNFVPLARHLLALGFNIEVETAGTLWLEDFRIIETACHVTVSPKTPKINCNIERVAKSYKYIIQSGIEFSQALAWPTYGQEIFVQPMDNRRPETKNENIRATIEVAMNRGYRISLQTHKILGVE